MSFDIHHSECVAFMKTLPDNSIDAIVTDPPYGLSFMGKKWDYDVPGEDVWRECLRVLKPGGHLLAFAGTRTQHRMAVRIEDAGFEIRDMIAWVYGSGFPKSLDISKAIDKAAGADHLREFKCKNPADRPYTHEAGETSTGWQSPVRPDKTHPATPAAKTWQGWGTALKPALEPITVARKPFTGTVANNVLTWGTGGVNVDACRVDFADTQDRSESVKKNQHKEYNSNNGIRVPTKGIYHGDNRPPENYNPTLGRFPANFIHDGSDEVVGMFPETKAAGSCSARNFAGWKPHGELKSIQIPNDSGSAARFFYCAKASKRDRDEGCEGMDVQHVTCRPESDSTEDMGLKERLHGRKARNHHPTVKPTDLMRYLCRLVTPTGGTVLDPFMGSGSTGKAAVLEGFNFIGCDMTAEYVDIARARIMHAFNSQPNKLDL